MDALKKTRRPLRSQLVKRINELNTELSAEQPDRTVVQVKVEMLEKIFSKLQTVDDEIAVIVNRDGSDQDQDEEFEGVAEYEEKYRTAKVRGDNFLEDQSDRTSSTESGSGVSGAVAHSHTRMKTYKLPKIELKKFDGDLKNWLGFWSQFEKIHSDDKLHDSDKFQYLVQSMVTGSRAEKLVSSYPQSAENYPKVVTALKDRFGDKVLLTEVYVRQLLKLVVHNVGAGRSSSGLKSVGTMYDDLESHLRALETLGVTQDQSAAFLYPLVESSLPGELLRVWQRSTMAGYDSEAVKPVDERLKSLMKFLKGEVKGAERLSYVSESFVQPVKEKVVKDKRDYGYPKLPTAAGLFAGQKSCVFCEKSHDSQICASAQTMPYGMKKRKIMEKRACLCCLRIGHMAKTCKAFVKCIVCQHKHVTLMCPELDINKKDGDAAKSANSDETVTEVPQVHAQLNCTNEVLLQTLRVVVHNGRKSKEVRMLLDPGSQKSYILEKTARQLGLESEAKVKLCHLLFGGHKEAQQHNVYEVEIESSGGRNRSRAKLKLLGHEKICGKIPRMSKGPWMAELKDKKIFLNDLGEDEGEIEVLIGSDYYPQWITGRKHFLQNGLVALETSFGWTVSGKLNKVHDEPESNVAMQVTSMFLAEANVSELWDLETIGIHEPVEKEVDKQADAKQHFLETVKRSDEGRYVVSLPWIEAGSSYIIDNRDVAEKRLASITTKLQAQGKYQRYSKVFDDWVAEDIIEVVDETVKKDNCYYLPHRPVFKPDSLTTPVRPVFDASCKTNRKPSLNELLEKGPNLMELVPTILLRFRMNEIGVIADIRKAFQMIEVRETDRDFLRFLWWENPVQQNIRVYRHKRVVFGVNCSPFLLAAVLELHLKSVSGDHLVLAEKLLKSFYVDNCVTSVNTYEEYEHFRSQATRILSEAKMELRDWECTLPTETRDVAGSNCRSVVFDADREQNSCTKVLGLVWDKAADCLSCEIPLEDDVPVQSVTKRGLLAYITKIFDPIGLLCPALLPVKLILQSAWVAKVGWDERLPEEVIGKFKKWHVEIKCLQDVQVARHVSDGHCSSYKQVQLHTFCDASQNAYAAVVYLRTTDDCGHVSVQLLMAKSRLAPVKRLLTIPRMELLACLIGARLTRFIRESLEIISVPCFLWSDSSTAISWIKRNDEWGTFVGNRVKEICSLTTSEDWRHVPGVKNPADLPSRGCSPVHLLESRWWEGPDWLRFQPDDWPVEQFDIDEAAVLAERRMSAQKNHKMNSVDMSCLEVKSEYNKEPIMSVAMKSSLVVGDLSHENPDRWYMRTSSYVKNIRIVAWIRRFTSNSKPSSAGTRQTGNMSMQEICEAETLIVRSIQQEEFPSEAKTIKSLLVVKASDELLRVRTKLIHSRQAEGFRYPILLPSGHPFVILMIRWYHLKYYHAGAQFLMNKIRERFWLLRSRRTISKVIRRCTTCLRHTSKGLSADPAALPLSRTEAVSAFATTGVDLAGPLYMKNGDKVWVILFTCAVYRCVHLDFVTSLSTEIFLNALERFINVRGRPHQIYSDNGSNFVGAVSLFSKLNWNKIEALASTHQIKWIFNPPSAAWWGGWWERLIRIVKDLLKRMLGKERLDYEQLRTSLSHVENIINERPLTVVTEDQNDLVPLTPAMFLRGIRSASFPEGTLVQGDFQNNYQKRQSLQLELKSRFQKEYLSQLVQRAGEVNSRRPKVGDVVLVGSDDKRRLQWPLARIIELIPGRDGIVRTVRVKTHHGMLLRPIQRLYPLEVSSSEEVHAIQEKKQKQEIAVIPDADFVTRVGRKVNRPKRLLE